MKGLVIDPATKSLGYALIEKGKIVKSGTIELKGKLPFR